ncbi:MAG: P27 family phage terminase small subunit [Gammaproteobacteria bacterium]|nr:P27 family phage terminase small subunit [Gammaproteobacteria bacterium]
MKGKKPDIPKKGVPLKVVQSVTQLQSTAVKDGISIPEAPNFMSEEARRVWDELTPFVVAKGHWEPQYTYQFAGYCESAANFILATGDIAAMGRYFMTQTRNGEQEKKRAAWGQQQEALSQMQRLAAVFGLSPVDAGRLNGEGQGDLFDDALAQLNGTN